MQASNGKPELRRLKSSIVFSMMKMCIRDRSDAAVMSVWPTIKPYLTPGKALYFSHGFACLLYTSRCV